ncbi:MAG: hypothetical protein B6D55_00815, partial [Candidatus Omnitrophica bacterium 4484_70.2]
KILNLPPIRLEWLAEEMKENKEYKSVYHLPLLLNFIFFRKVKAQIQVKTIPILMTSFKLN